MHLFEAEKLKARENGMRTLRGKGNHAGSAIGKTFFFSPRKTHAADRDTQKKNDEAERERYLTARRNASNELRRLYGELRSESDAAWIFLMQITMLDGDLFTGVPELYLSEGKSAEESVLLCRDYFFSVLCGGAGGENLLSLALDVEDVCLRILKALGECEIPRIKHQSILLSRCPLPSYIAEQRNAISGIVASSLTDHAHIKELATSLKIPFIYTDTELNESYSEKNALIDAARGCLYIDPDLATLGSFTDEARIRRNEEDEEISSAQNTLVNKDGKRIRFLAELDGSADTKRLRPSVIDGIGRFSSEELYLREMCPPDEELLFDEYRRLAESMPTKPIIIRALKTAGTVHLNSVIAETDDDAHPDLYVTYDTTLRTQLRAVMRAAAYGLLEFSLPSAKRYSDIFTCASLMEELSSELYEEEREFNPVPLGASVSDAATALMCDKLLDECDFLIIEKEKLCLSLTDNRENAVSEEDSVCFDALGTLIGNIQKCAQKKKKRLILSLGKSGTLNGLSRELLSDFTYISTSLDTLSPLKKSLLDMQKG